MLVHDCTFYITAGHDEGTNGFYLRDWYVLSSTDMVNWTDNGGPVLTLDVFSWADANAWASQMVERNGKFYWSDGPGGGTYRRQVTIEKLTFNGDGTIEHITPSSGLSF